MAALGGGNITAPRVVFPGVALERTRPKRSGSSLARRGRVALPALAAAVVLLVAVGSIDPSVLSVLPALALALLLIQHRYPGEKALVALSRSRLGEPRPILRSSGTRSRRWVGPPVPRGGLLLACSLADRPPPLLMLAAR